MNIARLMEGNLDGRSVALTCVLILLASVAFYSQTFQYDFARYDDYRDIVGNPQLYSTGTVAERVKQIFFLDFPREEPLPARDLSWLADSLIFGFDRPFGYHYSNVIYHGITLVLAFLLILRLTNASTALAAGTLLLFLAVHAEPVAWIMGRKDILSSMFALLSILSFLQFQKTGRGRLKYGLYLLSLLLCGAAFLSKFNTVVLPGLLFLCALMNREGFRAERIRARDLLQAAPGIFIQVVPFLLLALVEIAWYGSVQADYGIFSRAAPYSLGDYGKVVFILDPLIFLEYLRIVLFPWNLQAYYSAPSIFSDFSTAEVALAIFVIASTIATIALLWRTNRVACLLFLCFLVAMLPYGNWAHFGFWYANRYVYFASIFLIAAFASVLTRTLTIPRLRMLKLLMVVCFGWVLAQNIIYRSQFVDVWENGGTLWKHETSLPSASIHDFNNLTAYYIGQSENSSSEDMKGWLQKAEAANEAALSLDVPTHDRPWLAVARYHRGLILAYSDAPLETQLADFLQAARMAPGYADALRATGAVYFRMATQEADPDRREELARESLSFMRLYFENEFHTQQSHIEQQNILKELKKEFPDLEIKEPLGP